MTDIKSTDVAELAVKYFKSGLYCSEAILRAFNEVYNLGLPENAYKISTGFGAGLGRSGCMCGTVAAAAMVMGLAAGRNSSCESENIVFPAINKLHDRFKAEHKALCCRVLTRSVVWNSTEHKKQCEKFVFDTAKWTEEILKTELKEYLPSVGSRSAPPKKILKYILSRISGRNY